PVTARGRARRTRRDLPGHPLRGERPFRILVETSRGEEVMEADAVLDASGVYDRPAAVGVGGIPARGERALDGTLIHRLDALQAALPGLGGKAVLLVGHGHSAAGAASSTPCSASPAIGPICRSSPSWPSRSRPRARARQASPARWPA